MHTNRLLRFCLIAAILLTTLACTISFSDSGKDNDLETIKLELTRQALEKAQADLDEYLDQGQSDGSNNPPSNNQPESEPEDVEEAEEEEEDETPCNDSHIIGETITDGTVFEPGETFQKTWTLRNEGDCDWTTSYKLKFIEGSRMGGASSISVPSVIEPWEDITFQVNLTAPDDPGNYIGVWQLFAEDGEEMGRYWVDINVEDPTPPFAVTSVTTNITNKNFSGACPQVIDVEVYITVNGPGEITYQPETSDLGKAPVDTIQFNGAGTDTEFYTWTIQNSGNFWLKVYIDDPNHQTFGPFNMSVTCQ